MVPVLTNGGRSFKGAALYYLHDKRAAGEAERLTTARIAWAETVNLMTDDPERAWRMMATTAMAQAELKRAAGIKAGGRKLENPVLAYSLAWHPDERPDRAEQLAAARETLPGASSPNLTGACFRCDAFTVETESQSLGFVK